MKFSESLKRNSDFQRVYREGKSYANRYLVLYVLQNQTERNRLGISVSKKVGNAVVRNRTKRRLRECFRPYLGDVKNGLYVFVARPSAAEATFQSLEKSMRYLIRKQGVLKEGNRAR